MLVEEHIRGEVETSFLLTAVYQLIRPIRSLENTIFIEIARIDVEALKGRDKPPITVHRCTFDFHHTYDYVVEGHDLISAPAPLDRESVILDLDFVAVRISNVRTFDLRDPHPDVIEPAVVRRHHENILQLAALLIYAKDCHSVLMAIFDRLPRLIRHIGSLIGALGGGVDTRLSIDRNQQELKLLALRYSLHKYVPVLLDSGGVVDPAVVPSCAILNTLGICQHRAKQA